MLTSISHLPEARLAVRTFLELADGIISLDSGIRNCILVSEPSGAILAVAAARTDERTRLSKIVQTTSGMTGSG